MWIFTKHGVFSVVSAGVGKMQIRARNANHLRTLKRKIATLVNVPIQTDPQGVADYFCRLIVPVLKWQVVMGYLADEAASYSNFKDELRQSAGDRDPELLAWAHETWHRGKQYQKAVQGGGTDDEDEAIYADGSEKPKRKSGPRPGPRIGR